MATISLEDALQKKTTQSECNNTENVVLSYTDSNGINQVGTVPVSYLYTGKSSSNNIDKVSFKKYILYTTVALKTVHSIKLGKSFYDLDYNTQLTINKKNVSTYIEGISFTDSGTQSYSEYMMNLFNDIAESNFFLWVNTTNDASLPHVMTLRSTDNLQKYDDDIDIPDFDKYIVAIFVDPYRALGIERDYSKNIYCIAAVPLINFGYQGEYIKLFKIEETDADNLLVTVTKTSYPGFSIDDLMY